MTEPIDPAAAITHIRAELREMLWDAETSMLRTRLHFAWLGMDSAPLDHLEAVQFQSLANAELLVGVLGDAIEGREFSGYEVAFTEAAIADLAAQLESASDAVDDAIERHIADL